MAGDEAVHIIDDDASLRSALETLLRSAGIEALSFPSTAAFVDGPHADRAGCLLLDVRLPGTSGLDFQAQMAQLGLKMPVILMTGHGDIPMSVRGMKAGAVDFLPKPFRDRDLLAAVAQAFVVDRARRSADAERAGLRARYDTLTKREREVMVLVTAGKPNKEAAAHLSLSEISVKVHRAAVMRKMRAGSLPDLVHMTATLDAGRTSVLDGGQERFDRQALVPE